MQLKYFLLIFFLAGTISFNGYSQKGYKIDIIVNDIPDKEVFLGYYYDGKTYAKDTTKSDASGHLTFEGVEKLPEGVYFLMADKQKFFDFVVGDDQSFSLKAPDSEYIKSMEIESSHENELFYDNMRFNFEQNEKAKPYLSVLQDSTSEKSNRDAAEAEFDKINQEVMAFQDSVINNFPNSVLGRMMAANKPVQVPDNIKDDRELGYAYYKSHFFDNMDLSDPIYLRLSQPVVKEKLDVYFDKVVSQHPDSLIKEIDRVAQMASSNEDMYRFVIWNMVLKYQNPKIMGLDKVFVHLNDEYFQTGKMDYWASASLKKNLGDYSDKLRKSLIGMKGANLIMQDVNLNKRELYNLNNKYTVIYFFDPDCGHCKKETPVLVDFFNTTQFDVGVFAVSTDTSLTKMSDYIKEMKINFVTVNGPRTYVGNYQDLYDAYSTPTIYILDENKKIIAKKLPAARIEEFLENYEKAQNQ
ncbi:TlpA family protein disulfide reductase [Marinigracilibium pacificum]|uniref:DUF5106 domain-containing protein n=1 Tax=Marinigracilibium pacificum TaxID=2729599 RepID=A0A848IR52_9BACT|nr:TlpA family protein disulfide reductase [Marinigracilibium pacificum]NMM46943.1 DUF5106 domain-containing protein [Marinigracilibium pacificum]